MKGNQLRVYLSAIAYTLVEALRRLALKSTEWAEAQVDTIRLKQFQSRCVAKTSQSVHLFSWCRVKKLKNRVPTLAASLVFAPRVGRRLTL